MDAARRDFMEYWHETIVPSLAGSGVLENPNIRIAVLDATWKAFMQGLRIHTRQ